MVKGLEDMSCDERPRTRGLSGLEKRRPRDDLTTPCTFPRREGREGGAGLRSLGTDDRKQGNGTKLGLGRFRLDTAKKILYSHSKQRGQTLEQTS